MARCPSCDYPLPEDRERLGARCPSCRDSLYEPPSRFARPLRPGESACTVHANNEALGTCGRCGNFLCEICRCKWREQILCVPCVERALASKDATPEQARGHFRQALFGLLLGLGAWLMAGLAYAAAVSMTVAQGAMNMSVILLMMVVWLAACLPALFGVGQAAAALHTRGNNMILATMGLILSGLYVGILLGLLSFGVWQS